MGPATVAPVIANTCWCSEAVSPSRSISEIATRVLIVGLSGSRAAAFSTAAARDRTPIDHIGVAEVSGSPRPPAAYRLVV